MLSMNTENNQKDKKSIGLSLSDVIKIDAPDNQVLNEQSFIIDYIDPIKIKLINIDDFTTHQLNIDNNDLADKSIKRIRIISKDPNKGYARQNNLLPGKWINIYIGGDTPAIITAEITNLENDMIELKTFPDNEILYINFNYHGMPETIPITLIEERDKPESLALNIEHEEGIEEEKDSEDVKDKSVSEQSLEDFPTMDEDTDLPTTIPLPTVKNILKDFIISADELISVKILPAVKTKEAVPESEQRFNIQSQTNSLLDELLSKVPDNKRTEGVLNNIHILIERFKQLRDEYSTFDKDGVIEEYKSDVINEKPLIKHLLNFNKKLAWVIPVAKNIKKLYNISDYDNMVANDIIPLKTFTDIEEIKDILDNYKSNSNPHAINAYNDLLYKLNPYFTPFEDINYEYNNEIINNVNIHDEVECIINNLDDFYSSVAENDIVKSQRFVIQKYELGIKRLEATSFKGTNMETHTINITEPDNLSLSSIITLPTPVINYSRIDLPNTNISQKANLNKISLETSKILNDKTYIKNIIIDNFNDTTENKTNPFGKKIINYGLEHTKAMNNMSSNEIYKHFLQKSIPKTQVLFQLMKKYIPANYEFCTTFYSAIQLLEPFLIYSKNISIDEYKEITSFISQNISDYNKLFKEREKAFDLFKKVQISEPFSATKILSLIPSDINSKKNIIDYNPHNLEYSNSELLWKMKLMDFANIYDDLIALSNIDLLLPQAINEIIKHLEEQGNIIEKEIEKEKNKDEKEKKCLDISIAKKYNNIQEIDEDNDKTIYFDKQYDTDTPYEIMNNYEKQQNSMNATNFYEFLLLELVNKYKYNSLDAPEIATSLINNHKEVKDGQYATYYDNGNNKLMYFKRVNNKWKLDDTMDKLDINSNDMSCMFQNECIEIKEKYDTICETYNLNKKTLTDNALKEMINNFNKKFEVSKDILKTKLSEEYKYSSSIFQKLQQIHYNQWISNNDEKYNIGLTVDVDDNIVSPYASKMEKILGNTDFIEKQHQILSFANKYTRPANIMFNGGSSDDINWRYCIKTNIKLLPVFYYTLAAAYIENPDSYNTKLNYVIKEIGTSNDDGESIVDIHSGRVIVKRDFDNDEGFTTEGYKNITRDVLEKESGDALLSAKEKTIKYTTPETRMMYNVISAVASFMGININPQMEFIINIASKELNGPNVLPSQEDYEEQRAIMAKNGKKMDDYETLYHATLLYFTLGAFLIGVQTSVPSIKTRATYPGCIRSFTGYPFGGTGDFTALTYLACIVHKTKKTTIPWNAINKKKQETITKYIKKYIDNFYLESPIVLRRFEEKIQYVNTHRKEDIPLQYSLGNWVNFLPPLKPFKLKEIEHISDEFRKSLLNNLRSGSPSQLNKILVIEGRIMYFSLMVQQLIQDVLTKKKWLLTNNTQEPFLENACCNEKKQLTAIQYFVDQSPDIALYNTRVEYLSNIIDDIVSLTKAVSLYCNIDSKNKYAPLSDKYSEETIYKAFIIYCNFNSLRPISNALQPVCYEKPERINYKDSIQEIITKLKDEGVKYSQKEFQKLLQLVNNSHTIYVDTSENTISNIEKMRIMLNQLASSEDTLVEKNLVINLTNTLDTFDLSVTEDSDAMRELKNYLALRNKELLSQVSNYIKKYAKASPTKKTRIENFLNEIMEWGEGDPNQPNDNTTYNCINFVKTYIANFVKVFPFIIKNKIDYDPEAVNLPKYWKLSGREHAETLSIINDYYYSLRLFYNNPILFNILDKVHFGYADLLNLIIDTPYLSDIDYNNTSKSSVLDKRTIGLLFKNYLLLILNTYIQLADDKAMVENENVVTKFKISNDDDDDEYNSNYLSKNIVAGNLKLLKNNVGQLLFNYLEIMMQHKKLISKSYNAVMDVVFKLKETEKYAFTDRLQGLKENDEDELDIDTLHKKHKLGKYSVKTWEERFAERNINYATVEDTVRNNYNANDNNLDMLMEEQLENIDNENQLDRDNNDLTDYHGEDGNDDPYGEDNYDF